MTASQGEVQQLRGRVQQLEQQLQQREDEARAKEDSLRDAMQREQVRARDREAKEAQRRVDMGATIAQLQEERGHLRKQLSEQQDVAEEIARLHSELKDARRENAEVKARAAEERRNAEEAVRDRQRTSERQSQEISDVQCRMAILDHKYQHALARLQQQEQQAEQHARLQEQLHRSHESLKSVERDRRAERDEVDAHRARLEARIRQLEQELDHERMGESKAQLVALYNARIEEAHQMVRATLRASYTNPNAPLPALPAAVSLNAIVHAGAGAGAAAGGVAAAIAGGTDDGTTSLAATRSFAFPAGALANQVSPNGAQPAGVLSARGRRKSFFGVAAGVGANTDVTNEAAAHQQLLQRRASFLPIQGANGLSIDLETASSVSVPPSRHFAGAPQPSSPHGMTRHRSNTTFQSANGFRSTSPAVAAYGRFGSGGHGAGGGGSNEQASDATAGAASAMAGGPPRLSALTLGLHSLTAGADVSTRRPEEQRVIHADLLRRMLEALDVIVTADGTVVERLLRRFLDSAVAAAAALQQHQSAHYHSHHRHNHFSHYGASGAASGALPGVAPSSSGGAGQFGVASGLPDYGLSVADRSALMVQLANVTAERDALSIRARGLEVELAGVAPTGDCADPTTGGVHPPYHGTSPDLPSTSQQLMIMSAGSPLSGKGDAITSVSMPRGSPPGDTSATSAGAGGAGTSSTTTTRRQLFGTHTEVDPPPVLVSRRLAADLPPQQQLERMRNELGVGADAAASPSTTRGTPRAAVTPSGYLR
jgi:hypothetical protein